MLFELGEDNYFDTFEVVLKWNSALNFADPSSLRTCRWTITAIFGHEHTLISRVSRTPRLLRWTPGWNPLNHNTAATTVFNTLLHESCLYWHHMDTYPTAWTNILYIYCGGGAPVNDSWSVHFIGGNVKFIRILLSIKPD